MEQRATYTHPQKQNHPVKNRAWDFSSDSSICTWVNRPQLPETASVTSACRYETVSGISYWLSRDPIEEADGPGLYLFLNNDAVNKVDPLGLNASLVFNYTKTEYKDYGFFDFVGSFDLINKGSLTGEGSIIQNMFMDYVIYDCETGDILHQESELRYAEVFSIGETDEWHFTGGDNCTRGKAVWKGVAQYYDSYNASHVNDPWNLPWGYGNPRDGQPWGNSLLGINAWVQRVSDPPDAQGYSRSLTVVWNSCDGTDKTTVKYSGAPTNALTP
jgi:hypothetical protein